MSVRRPRLTTAAIVGVSAWVVMLAIGSCRDNTPSEPTNEPNGVPMDVAANVQASRYATDLDFLARSRPPGSPHWQDVQDHCFRVFEEAGLTTQRQTYSSGVNVLGELPGTSDELVIVGAHYDHLQECAGADDNASGVAAVLEAARVLSGGRYERTLLFACWDEEEAGLRGSRAFADSLERPVAAHFNLEMIAFASDEPNSQQVPGGLDLLFPEPIQTLQDNGSRGDFIAVVADERSAAAAESFSHHAERHGLPSLVLDVPDALKSSPLLSDLRRSDHAPFWDRDLPGLMLTDTADFRNANYHCIGGPDVVSTLDVDFAIRVVRATVGAAADQLRPR